jgi:hypothetical protein
MLLNKEDLVMFSIEIKIKEEEKNQKKNSLETDKELVRKVRADKNSLNK